MDRELEFRNEYGTRDDGVIHIVSSISSSILSRAYKNEDIQIIHRTIRHCYVIEHHTLEFFHEKSALTVGRWMHIYGVDPIVSQQAHNKMNPFPYDVLYTNVFLVILMKF